MHSPGGPPRGGGAPPQAQPGRPFQAATWEARSDSDPHDLSQRVSDGPQATPVAPCDISILIPRLERSQQHLLHSSSFCSVGSVLAVVVNLSEITTFSDQFSLFELLGCVLYSCHWVRNVDIYQGQVWHLYLEGFCHFLTIHSLCIRFKDGSR